MSRSQWTDKSASPPVLKETSLADPLPVRVVGGGGGGSGGPTADLNPDTAPSTSVALTTGASVVMAANNSRYGVSVSNPTAAICYLLTAASGTPSASLHQAAVPPGGYWECPFGYTGAIRGALSTGSGSVLVTEFT